MAIHAGLQPIVIGEMAHPGLADVPRFASVEEALPFILGSAKGFP
jgi:hypothetical protein